MDANAILKQLYEERDAIDQAIVSLQQLTAGRGQKRRGRPPKWMAEAREKMSTGKPEKKPARVRTADPRRFRERRSGAGGSWIVCDLTDNNPSTGANCLMFFCLLLISLAGHFVPVLCNSNRCLAASPSTSSSTRRAKRPPISQRSSKHAQTGAISPESGSAQRPSCGPRSTVFAKLQLRHRLAVSLVWAIGES